MRVIVVGCGRMGRGLAEELDLRGHEVTVVDRGGACLEELGSGFGGRTLVGDGFDRDLLLEAGVERADGLAALVGSDEANVVMARAALEEFHVPRVVARLYDPRKAEIYRRLGLLTIAPVEWGVRQALELLTYASLGPMGSVGTGEVELVQAEVTAVLAGRRVSELGLSREVLVVAVTRQGRTFLASTDPELETGDLLVLAMSSGTGDRVARSLGLA